ncbi:MAG: glycerol-3-phosphate acyltransferase, partial [Bdellovibrio sp.]|nr:glycerol-3-phosphate acyltransferase [Bdellovibrio sp.]
MIELIILFYIVVFLLGSIPFGLIFSRVFYQRDITGLGSGNIGTTNVSRVFGFWPVGCLTLFCDVLKGAIPIIVLKLGFFSFLFDDDTPLSENILWLSGFISVLGHCYSPFLKFQGGKGVATSFGCFLL